jgi:hypothetical protein
MRSASPSRSSCELSREVTAPRQAGPRRSGAWSLRTSTNDRYRRQNAPFMTIALNYEVGWEAVLRRDARGYFLRIDQLKAIDID